MINSAHPSLSVFLVDPSLFTAPYDAALTAGLVAAGVRPLWIIRPTRLGDRQEIAIELTDPFFYRGIDRAVWLPARLYPVAKGAAHLVGLIKLVLKIRSQKPDIVHFQWIVVPLIDTAAMYLIRRWCPIVLTVHDTVPFNGERMSWLQRLGHDGPMKLATRLIVHTQAGRQALIKRGQQSDKIEVIAHGALSLPTSIMSPATPLDPRWTFVLFGEIKPYKGLELLIEAFGLLPKELQSKARVIVAGRLRMDVSFAMTRISELGLSENFDLRFARQSELEMAALFAQADCFVFPYSQVDASGVYFLVKDLGKWLIASRVGVFAEELSNLAHGMLFSCGSTQELSDALAASIVNKPVGAPANSSSSWLKIGSDTCYVYNAAINEFKGSHARTKLV